MSGTELPRPLKGDALGRVVRLMRRELTDLELSQVLERRYTAKTWRKASIDYNLIPRETRWNCALIDEAVIAFAKKVGRWPVDRDWGTANFLPSGGVFRYHDSIRHFCNGSLRPVETLPFWDRIINHAREGKVPPNLVLRIPNQVKRRDAIMAIGGPVTLVQSGLGNLVQQDDFGKLWRVHYVEPNVRDWASMYVEVVNSTPRMTENGYGDYVLDPGPDGEPVYDHYFLRVPPHVQTAKEAVAWTGHFVTRSGERGVLTKFEGFVAQS